MRTHRTRFAAAWVIVGCSASPPRVAPEPEPPADAGAIAVVTPPPDAAPPDAAPPDAAPIDARPMPDFDPCAKFDPQHPVYCNPPHPSGAFGDIIDLETDGSGTLVVIDIGTRDGVSTGAYGDLLDNADQPIPGGGFRVTSASGRICRARLTMTKEQIKRSTLRVRIDF